MEAISTTILVGLVIGLTEVIKRPFNIGKKWIPLISLGWSFALGLLLNFGKLDGFAITQIVIIGLCAGGLWDLGKQTATPVIKSMFVKK